MIETIGIASRLKQAGDKSEQGELRQDAEQEARQRNIAGDYLGGALGLRFHFEHWSHAFAVVQPGRDGKLSHSLQFFDATGDSVHKRYVRSEAGVAVFGQLLAASLPRVR